MDQYEQFNTECHYNEFEEDLFSRITMTVLETHTHAHTDTVKSLLSVYFVYLIVAAVIY